MKIRLTKTGVLFLGLGAAFYLSAMTSQSGLLLLLVGTVIGCLAVNITAAWLSVRRIEIEPPPNALLCEGERLSQPWRLVNRGKGAVGLIRVESQSGVLLRVDQLAAGGEASIVPEQVFDKRGVFRWSELRITSIFPFGLIRGSRALDLPGEVVVAPAVYHAECPPAAGYDVMLGGKFKGHRPVASGAHFAGIRPFREGDSFKQIHWKSTARGQGLMVKTFEEEMSGRVSFVLDNGGNCDAAILDDCARAAGSLMFAALDAGHHVEAVDFERAQPLIVPPFADGQEILEWLGRLPSSTQGDRRFRSALELISKRSAVAFVLTRFTPQIRDAIVALVEHRRRVSVYLPAGASRPDVPAGVRLFVFTARELSEWA